MSPAADVRPKLTLTTTARFDAGKETAHLQSFEIVVL
jgi:hypothetical protein